jgi:hypothetical protein
MEEKTASAGQSALYYALLTGVALILTHLILYIAGISQDTVGQVISFVIFVLAIIVVQLDFRNKKLGGFISYGKAVKIGFLSILFASVIMAIYMFIYLSYINPGEMTQRLLDAQQQIYNYGLSPEQEASQLEMQEYIHTPTVYAIFTIVGYAVMGIVVALITAIFVKKEEKVSLG